MAFKNQLACELTFRKKLTRLESWRQFSIAYSSWAIDLLLLLEDLFAYGLGLSSGPLSTLFHSTVLVWKHWWASSLMHQILGISQAVFLQDLLGHLPATCLLVFPPFPVPSTYIWNYIQVIVSSLSLSLYFLYHWRPTKRPWSICPCCLNNFEG